MRNSFSGQSLRPGSSLGLKMKDRAQWDKRWSASNKGSVCWIADDWVTRPLSACHEALQKKEWCSLTETKNCSEATGRLLYCLNSSFLIRSCKWKNSKLVDIVNMAFIDKVNWKCQNRLKILCTWITGAYNDNATFTISKKLKAIMAERGFHLRKWNCNSLPCPFRNAIEHILSSFMHRETWLWWTTSRRNDQNMEFDIHRTERVISKYQDAIFTQGLQGLMHNSTHSAMHQTELMRLSCTYKLLTMMDALKQD